VFDCTYIKISRNNCYCVPRKTHVHNVESCICINIITIRSRLGPRRESIVKHTRLKCNIIYAFNIHHRAQSGAGSYARLSLDLLAMQTRQKHANIYINKSHPWCNARAVLQWVEESRRWVVNEDWHEWRVRMI